MKTRDKQMKFIFKCEAEARQVYEQAYSIAATYGRVTLADTCDLIGTTPVYEDTKIYWTATRFITDVKIHTNADDEWVMHISDYLSDESCDNAEETEDNLYCRFSTVEDIFIFVPSEKQIISIAEGDGSNLLDEDIADGFVDYIYYNQHDLNEAFTEVDGGQIMLEKPFRERYSSMEECIPDVLDMAYGNRDIPYIVLK